MRAALPAIALLLMSCSTPDVAASQSQPVPMNRQVGDLGSTYEAPGPYRVREELGEWTDPRRENRRVPYKLYLPQGLNGPAPVVIWSHGGGGSREGASYLGEHLASHGFIAVHIEHLPASGAAQGAQGRGGRLRDRLAQRRDGQGGRMGQGAGLAGMSGIDPASQALRFGDIPFVVDQIVAMGRSGPLAGLIDERRIGMSGHSFGARTTLSAAGQWSQEYGVRFAEPRLLAAFAMSPSKPNGDVERAFSDMLMPIFHLTGTADDSPVPQIPMSPEDRTVPFQTIDDVDQILLVLDGATHMTFSGRTSGRGLDYPGLERHHELIRIAAVAFWNTHLKDDPAARRWLYNGGFQAEVAQAGQVRVKPAR